MQGEGSASVQAPDLFCHIPPGLLLKLGAELLIRIERVGREQPLEHLGTACLPHRIGHMRIFLPDRCGIGVVLLGPASKDR